MTDAETVSRGNDTNSRGASEDIETTGDEQQTNGQDTEKSEFGMTDAEHATLKKALDEKKRFAQRAADAEERAKTLERQAKEREEQELKEKEDYKKLAEIREKEAKEANEKYNSLHSRVEETEKMTSVLQALKGEVDPKYWGMLRPELAEIPIHPETGLPDEVAVQNVAESFQTKFPEVVKVRSGANLPGEAASTARPFAPSQWQNMSAKDKKDNMKDFVEAKLKEFRK